MIWKDKFPDLDQESLHKDKIGILKKEGLVYKYWWNQVWRLDKRSWKLWLWTQLHYLRLQLYITVHQPERISRAVSSLTVLKARPPIILLHQHRADIYIGRDTTPHAAILPLVEAYCVI